MYNEVLLRYYSYTVDTDSCGVDCFSRKWSEENVYAFSPYAVISRKLKKIQEDRATGVIHSCYQRPTPPFIFFIEERKRQRLQMQPWSRQSCKTNGISDEVSSVLVQSWKSGTQAITQLILTDGFRFVLNSKQIQYSRLFS